MKRLWLRGRCRATYHAEDGLLPPVRCYLRRRHRFHQARKLIPWWSIRPFNYEASWPVDPADPMFGGEIPEWL